MSETRSRKTNGKEASTFITPSTERQPTVKNPRSQRSTSENRHSGSQESSSDEDLTVPLQLAGSTNGVRNGNAAERPLPLTGADEEVLVAKLHRAVSSHRLVEQRLHTFLHQDVTYMKEKAQEIRDSIDELLQRIHDVTSRAAEKVTDHAPLPSDHAWRDKIFKPQDSVLSTMLQIDEFRTIYHVFVAVLMVFGISVLIDEYIEKGVILELGMVQWAFGKLYRVVQLWWCMFGVALLVVPLMLVWREKILPGWIYMLGYIALQGALFAIAVTGILTFGLPIASSMIIVCEQTRLTMKMHAFVRESYLMAGNETRRKRAGDAAVKLPGGDAADLQLSPELHVNDYFLPTSKRIFQAYLFFLFAPTLIYRNSYPRTARIRWEFFFQRVAETFACVFYTYVIFTKFCVPQFERTTQGPGDWKKLVASVFTSTLPGILVFLLGFFGVLHSWCNAFAELCRFADRKFYADWWNATSFSVYYRKWNVVVHDWLYAYILVDMMKLGFSKNAAMLIVFAVSAVMHEYIITMALGFFYPVMLVMFGGVGVFFVWLTKLQKGNRAWNVFMWFMLLIGNGCLMVLYSREWYARNTQSKVALDPTSWIPYSWQVFF